MAGGVRSAGVSHRARSHSSVHKTAPEPLPSVLARILPTIGHQPSTGMESARARLPRPGPAPRPFEHSGRSVLHPRRPPAVADAPSLRVQRLHQTSAFDGEAAATPEDNANALPVFAPPPFVPSRNGPSAWAPLASKSERPERAVVPTSLRQRTPPSPERPQRGPRQIGAGIVGRAVAESLAVSRHAPNTRRPRSPSPQKQIWPASARDANLTPARCPCAFPETASPPEREFDIANPSPASRDSFLFRRSHPPFRRPPGPPSDPPRGSGPTPSPRVSRPRRALSGRAQPSASCLRRRAQG